MEGRGLQTGPIRRKNNSVKSRFKVMVWGYIIWYGIGTLSFVDGNRWREILEENLWSVIGRHFPTGGEIFQDDGAPVHTANFVKAWKRKNGINTLPCRYHPPPPPPYSPDLNPIENCWAVIKKNYSSMFWRLNRK